MQNIRRRRQEEQPNKSAFPEGLRRIHEDELRKVADLTAKTARAATLSEVAVLLNSGMPIPSICEPTIEDIGQAIEILQEQAEPEEDKEPLRARCERLEEELEDYKHRAQQRLAELTEQIGVLKAQAKPQVDLWTDEDLWNAVGLAKGEILSDIAALLGCELHLDEIGQAIEALKAAAQPPGLDDEVAELRAKLEASEAKCKQLCRDGLQDALQVTQAAEEQRRADLEALAWARAEAETSALTWVAEHILPPGATLAATPQEIRQEIEQALAKIQPSLLDAAAQEAARKLGRDHAETRRRHWSTTDELKKLLKEVERASGATDLQRHQEAIFEAYKAAYAQSKRGKEPPQDQDQGQEWHLGDQVVFQRKKRAVIVHMRPDRFADLWIRPQPGAKDPLARNGYWELAAWEHLDPDPQAEEPAKARQAAIKALNGEGGNSEWAEGLIKAKS